MYGCQQDRVKSNSNIIPVLEHICLTANNLTNCGIYYARQTFFNESRIIGKYEPEEVLKQQVNFKALYSQCAQQVLRSVAESFKSYKGLRKAFFKGEISNHPKLPNYRNKGGMAVASYPKQALKLKSGQVRVPLGKTIKAWFGLSEFFVPFPSNLEWESIKELRILPRNREFYIEWVYERPEVKTTVNSTEALGVDPGLDNWLTCVSTIGESFIIDGKKVKSLNQNYHRRVSSLKKGKPQGYWDGELARITEKRNRQIRDAVNKAAKMVVNYCLNKDIGIIVFGWNKGQRQGVNIGKKNNQNFVQIPTAKLKNRIQQLAKEHGIEFVETEESYTSKASFLDRDLLPTFGEKPERWQPSGKRVTRGCYQDSQGRIVNADAQAAANILRKVEIQLGLVLAKVSRAALNLPQRFYLWNSKRKARSIMALGGAVC
ncbi:transposase, IS605 OrfB family [Halothece sp. PCC 7418]|uniref:RNA-guided endonuclease InsQ/TnpB family protein n=1 Tax=Halothece sp. (strain PCC 7418) TaxID=65093 RepID=UPI0002A08359|nr:RNA-guided endonuclease TnpB family protein [Halothece sp. PCC 7418]AFZ44864.1 transposase, IS605 OrfB family [Halothece sp. PCC 7418]